MLYSKHPTSSILRHLASLQYWVPKLQSYYAFVYSPPLELAIHIVNADSFKEIFEWIIAHVSLSHLYNIIDIHYYVWSEMEWNNQGHV